MSRHKEYRWGIQTKLSLASGLLVLISLASFAIFSYFVTRGILDDQMGKRLVSHAKMAAAALQWPDLLSEIPKLGRRTYPLWQKRLAEAKDAADLDNVILIGVGNKTLVDANGELPVGQEYVMVKADEEELKSVWEEGNAKASMLYPGKEGRLYKSAYSPVMTEERRVVAVIRVEASAEFLDIVNKAGVILLVSALIITAMAALLGMLIARSIVIPIKQLVRASQRIAYGDLDTEVFIRSRDEIGFFARTFNQMSRNLKRLYQEVEERGRQIVELSASVAHEVRSPISAIQGFTELLEDDMDDDDPGLEYIADIKNEIKILSSKITDFIHFARPLEIEPIPLDIGEVLDSALVSMDKEVTDSDVSVVTNFDSALPAVQGDFDQLRSIFVNLIRNAVQAMDEGGGMIISTSAASKNMQDTNADLDCVEIRIEDTGCGMDPGAMEHAFEPFFTTKGSGTGLGLAIVKKIVDVHNGKIELESDVGRGTIVKVILPISRSMAL